MIQNEIMTQFLSFGCNNERIDELQAIIDSEPQKEILRKFLSSSYKYGENEIGFLPILVALNRLDAVQLLLKDDNLSMTCLKEDSKGWTPIHWSVALGLPEMTNLLLSNSVLSNNLQNLKQTKSGLSLGDFIQFSTAEKQAEVEQLFCRKNLWQEARNDVHEELFSWDALKPDEFIAFDFNNCRKAELDIVFDTMQNNTVVQGTINGSIALFLMTRFVAHLQTKEKFPDFMDDVLVRFYSISRNAPSALDATIDFLSKVHLYSCLLQRDTLLKTMAYPWIQKLNDILNDLVNVVVDRIIKLIKAPLIKFILSLSEDSAAAAEEEVSIESTPKSTVRGIIKSLFSPYSKNPHAVSSYTSLNHHENSSSSTPSIASRRPRRASQSSSADFINTSSVCLYLTDVVRCCIEDKVHPLVLKQIIDKILDSINAFLFNSIFSNQDKFNNRESVAISRAELCHLEDWISNVSQILSDSFPACMFEGLNRRNSAASSSVTISDMFEFASRLNSVKHVFQFILAAPTITGLKEWEEIVNHNDSFLHFMHYLSILKYIIMNNNNIENGIDCNELEFVDDEAFQKRKSLTGTSDCVTPWLRRYIEQNSHLQIPSESLLIDYGLKHLVKLQLPHIDENDQWLITFKRIMISE